MTPEQWERISEIFEKALSLDGSAREAYLQGACAEDPAFRPEVDSLLASHIQAGSQFLNTSQEMDGISSETSPNAAIAPAAGSVLISSTKKSDMAGWVRSFAASRADGQYEKRVALKLVRTGYDTAFILERFRTERQILAIMDVPPGSSTVAPPTTPSPTW